MDERDYYDTVFQTKDILRMALLVGHSDGSLHPQEYEKAIEVFEEISEEYLGEHDTEFMRGQVERISDELREELDGMEVDEIFALAIEAAESIVDRSSQELALVSALRIAYGDYEIHELESRCITTIAKNWGISLKSVI